jgi:hypothetical protein
VAQVSVITTVGKTILSARIQHTTPGGATNSPPTLGSEAPGRGIAMGTGATTGGADAAATDLSLVQETEARATGAETITTNVYQSVGTNTATAARVVDEGGMFDSQSQTIATAALANSGATAVNIGAVNPFAASGTLHAYNDTSQAAGTPLGSQVVTFSAYANPNLTVTALTGAINSGRWITAGNLFARVTLRGVTIALNTNDSIQWTWQVTFS